MAAIERLASGYTLIEGPRVDTHDGLYFSDVRNGGVFYRSADGEIHTVVPKRKGVGGISLHADGGLVLSGRDICHVRDGETRTLFAPENTPGFNDLFCDAEGNVYTGTMRSNPFSTGVERTPGECWRIHAPGEATELYGEVSLTNGIGFSPDGSVIYHSDTAKNEVTAHDIAPDGTCSNRRAFAKLDRGLPDGLAVDTGGGVWVAAYGGGCVTRFSPDGKVDLHVEVPARSVTSLCFGGGDLRDLYIATADNTDDAALGGCIFRTRSAIAGLPAPLARI